MEIVSPVRDIAVVALLELVDVAIEVPLELVAIVMALIHDCSSVRLSAESCKTLPLVKTILNINSR